METWRTIAGYEGVYEVSDAGRVRRTKQACGTQHGRIKKPTLTHNGYLSIRLFRDGNKLGKGFFVHRLVTAAFNGPLPDGLQVNHKNGNKTDNRPENLEYLTCSDNALHARRVLHRGPNNKGARHGMAKLTDEQVIRIRALAASGRTQASLSIEFGCANSIVNRIVKRKIWKHI